MQKLGFGRNEALVYLALLMRGTSPARAVAAVVGMAREDVYRALKSLELKGFVNVTIDNPRLYAPNDPRSSVKLIISRLEDSFEATKQEAYELGLWMNLLQKQNQSRDEEALQGRFVVKLLTGKQVPDQGDRLIRGIKDDYLQVASSITFLQAHSLGQLDQVVKAAENGAKVRIITQLTEKNHEVVKRYRKLIEIRHYTHADRAIRFALTDKSSIVFGLAATTRERDELLAIYSNSVPLIEGFRMYFETLWRQAVPVAEALKVVD